MHFNLVMAHRVTNTFLVQGLLVLVLVIAQISIGYCVETTTTRTTTATATTIVENVVAANRTASTVSTTSATAATTTTTTKSVPHSETIIRESVLKSSADAEREAQELYDKALKQYGSYGASARAICEVWETKGCQCSGTVEELQLSCRNVGLEEVPLELPLDIVKL